VGGSRSGGTQDGSYAVDVEVRSGCHASAVLDTIRVGEVARVRVNHGSTRLTRRRQTAASFQFLPHPNGTDFFISLCSCGSGTAAHEPVKPGT
jgi:hypothetical protein